MAKDKSAPATKPGQEHAANGGSPGTSVAPLPKHDGDLVGVAMTDAAKAFLQEAKGKREVPNKIPIIQINHRECGFVLPSGEVVATVSGYPVYYFQTRRFYLKPPSPGAKGMPPDCWSADLIVPHHDSLQKQHETCAGCARNDWGTGKDGKSKACGTYTWVFLLNPTFGTPPLGVVVAPPSSIKALLGTRFSGGYFSQAAAKHGVHEIVWSEFRLKVEGDPRGVEYCTLDPVMGEPAKEVEKVRQICAIRNQFLEAMDNLRGTTPTVAVSHEE